MVYVILFCVTNVLYFYISTFRSMCAVANMVYFLQFLKYYLNNPKMAPVAPVITGTTFIFTFLMRYISIAKSLYFKMFSASFLINFLSPAIANIFWHTCSLFIMTENGVRLIVKGRFCRFALFNSIIWLPCCLDLFLLFLAHAHTSVHYLILSVVACIRWSAVEHTLYHVS